MEEIRRSPVDIYIGSLSPITYKVFLYIPGGFSRRISEACNSNIQPNILLEAFNLTLLIDAFVTNGLVKLPEDALGSSLKNGGDGTRAEPARGEEAVRL